MDNTKQTIAITGGASGIGKAIAVKFGRENFNIAIGDIEVPALEETIQELNELGIETLGVPIDVSDLSSMENFAKETEDTFGPVSIVCLNAGVGAGGETWDIPISDWEWVLSVNLWGVINGLKVFLPGMKERDSGHLVFTSSVAGHLSYPRMGPYNASKHAVLTIAETLYHELAEGQSGLGVSALCPGLVRTRILDSARNKPESLTDLPIEPTDQEQEIREAIVREIYDQALEPEHVANLVYSAVNEKKFYIFTDNSFTDALKNRHRNIEKAQNPTLNANLIEEHLND